MNWCSWDQTFMYKKNRKQMFLIIVIELVLVSMIQASENCLDIYTVGHIREHDFMIIGDDYWNTWECSVMEKKCCTAVRMVSNHADEINDCTINYCQERQEAGCLAVLKIPADAALHCIHMLEDFQKLGSFPNEQIGCKYIINLDGIRKFKFQHGSSVRNNTYCDRHLVCLTNTYPEQQQINQTEEINTEAIHRQYHSQLLELTLTKDYLHSSACSEVSRIWSKYTDVWPKVCINGIYSFCNPSYWLDVRVNDKFTGGVLCACVMISGFLLYCIVKLHLHDGTSFCSIQKKLLSTNNTTKEITITCQLSEGSRDENTDIEFCINCLLCPKGQVSRLCRVQPYLCDEKEVSEMDKNMLEKRALHRTVDVTAQTSISTESEVKSNNIKQITPEITVQTLDNTWIEDLQLKKGSCEVAAQTSLFTEVENLGGMEGTVKTNDMATNSTVEEDLTRKAYVQVTAKANEQAEVYKFRSVEECLKTTLKASFQDVESYRGECHVQGKELESSDDIITSHELVKEDYFGDDQKIEVLNQSLLQATFKSEGDQFEDRRNDISDYQDIHKGKNHLDEFGEILKAEEKHKEESYRVKESDVRDRTVTSTASQEWLKKNQDSDITLSLRDLSLSKEKDKTASCFQDHRKWLESQPSVSGVQPEFTPVTGIEESLLIVKEEPCDSFSLKYKEKNDENSSIIKGICSNFISLESEKKRKKSLCSKLHLRTTGNSSSFVSHKSKLKYVEDLINSNAVILSPCKKQETSLSVRAFFATEDMGWNQKKDANETEQQILSDMDVSVQKKKCEVEIYDRTVRYIDLQEKQKYNLRQIVWLPRNWLPLPRLGRDAIVGFVEEQTHNGHGGSTLSPSEHEELKEMLRQLASDNVPGPKITMKYEMLRLCTMKTFPGQDRPFAIRIVGAGFYYAGHKDQVICYCCGSRKEGWVLGDIPLLIHQNTAPDCDFLTHNALVNVPISKANSSADVRLVTIQRSDGSNQSDMAQGESSLMLPSSEQNQVSVLNTPHQMLVTNKSSPSNQLIASERQNVLNTVQTVSADTYSMEEPPPKYPQYAVKNMRIISFQGWPAELQQKPEEMAECGFYYAGFNDCVRCFHCGVGLRNWMNEDDPWIEHARWSTECIYVFRMKGEEFVSLVKMAVEIAEREEAIRNNGGGNQALQNSNETASAVPAKEGPNKSGIINSNAAKDLPSSVGATDGNAVKGAAFTLPPGNSEIQKYLLTDAAQSVLDMGYQPKLVLRAIERVLMRKGSEELTGQIIMEAVFEIEEEEKSQRKTQPTSLQSAEEDKTNGRSNINSDTGNKKDEQQGHVASGNIQSEESQIDPEEIMKEHRELCEATLCKICLENTISVVFLPCGHLVTCPDCAAAMRKCPICRTLIKGTVKTFYG